MVAALLLRPGLGRSQDCECGEIEDTDLRRLSPGIQGWRIQGLPATLESLPPSLCQPTTQGTCCQKTMVHPWTKNHPRVPDGSISEDSLGPKVALSSGLESQWDLGCDPSPTSYWPLDPRPALWPL